MIKVIFSLVGEFLNIINKTEAKLFWVKSGTE